MLPSVGYFRSIVCPFLENEICERPYCQFRHDLPPNRTNKTEAAKKTDATSHTLPGPSAQSTDSSDTKSLAIEQIVSEAVKRVLKENEELLGNVDAAKIMELVGQQKLVQKVVENLTPLQKLAAKAPSDGISSVPKNKNHKLYTIPAGIPAYTPTPLAVLKKNKPADSKVENYVPPSSSKKSVACYEPSKVTSKQEEAYAPSVSSKTVIDIDYKPSSRDADNIISDCYTPPSNSNCDLNYEPTNRELSSVEPCYNPSSNATHCSVDYSPSSKILLNSEPTYNPIPNVDTIQIDYTPSSCSQAKDTLNQLSPEQYLAMLENGKEEETGSKSSSRKHSSSTKHKHRDKDRRRSRDDGDGKSRHKERDRDKKSREEHKRKDRDKDEDRESSSSKRKERSSSSSSKSSALVPNSSSMQEDSESDVDEECYRIFQEYQPEQTGGCDDKKRKSQESTPTVSEAIIPVKKQRIAHSSSADSPAVAPVMKPVVPKAPPKLSPSMVMLERVKKMQAAAAARPLSSMTSPSSSTEKRRIAHVPNVAGLLTTKPKLPVSSSVATSKSTTSVTSSTSKAAGGPSAPAIRRQTTLPRPVIAIEYGCRVPANVRQRYLNIFVDEMLKIYDREEDAYDRALAEEKQCYTRSSNKTVYLNVVVNNVNRLRREAESGGIKPTHAADESKSSSSSDRKMVSHSAIIAGKGGATVSWSIEKPRSLKSVDSSLLSGASLYKLLERYILTMEQQEFYGYPRPDPTEKGRAAISSVNKFRAKPNLNLSADQRLCDRCGTVYRVNAKGLAIKADECSYHWGRPFQRRGEKRYSCCQGDSTSDGCCVAKWHVSDTLGPETMKGFVATLAKSPASDGNYGVYAIDCEMCYTTEGPELTRVTVVGSDHKTVYETLVKPDNPIIDHNTRFSGITEEDLQDVRTSIRDVQAVLLSKFSDKTILIGHSFDSDLRALRIIHNTVIDTSVVFPHPRGPPFKKALRTLCGELLQKIIQNDVGGHDSAEDAIACLELMLWKVKQDLKMLK